MPAPRQRYCRSISSEGSRAGQGVSRSRVPLGPGHAIHSIPPRIPPLGRIWTAGEARAWACLVWACQDSLYCVQFFLHRPPLGPARYCVSERHDVGTEYIEFAYPASPSSRISFVSLPNSYTRYFAVWFPCALSRGE